MHKSLYVVCIYTTHIMSSSLNCRCQLRSDRRTTLQVLLNFRGVFAIETFQLLVELHVSLVYVVNVGVFIIRPATTVLCSLRYSKKRLRSQSVNTAKNSYVTQPQDLTIVNEAYLTTDTEVASKTKLAFRWLGGIVVMALGSWSTGCEFDSRLCTWIGDHLWAGKPFRYVTSHLGQLSLLFLWGR